MTDLRKYVVRRVVVYLVICCLATLFGLIKHASAEGLITAYSGQNQLCSNPVILGELDSTTACLAAIPPGRDFCGVQPHPTNPMARRCAYAAENSTCDAGIDNIAGIVASSTQCNTLCEADTQLGGAYPTNANQFQCADTCEVEVQAASLVIYGTGLSGTATTGASATQTGQGCALGEDNSFSGANGSCVQMGSETVCITDPGETNCGTVNGEAICIDTPASGECYGTSGGGSICNADVSSTPPGPDDGTPGNVAPPDGTLTNAATGQTINYYSSSTINNSTVGNGGAGPNPGDGGGGTGNDGTGTDGTCDPATDECGDCDPIVQSCGTSVSGGLDCSAPPNVVGGPIFRSIILQEWKSRCPDEVTEQEILASSGLDQETVESLEGDPIDLGTGLDDSGFLGGGSCDIDASFDLGMFGSHTIPFSQWCGVLALLGNLVLISAGLISARIIGQGF